MFTLVKTNPYRYMWSAIPLVLVLGLIKMKASFDLQWHDTYFVAYLLHLAIASSLLLGITGFVYWLLRRYVLVNWLTILHVLLTILPLLGFMILGIWQFGLLGNDFEKYRIMNSAGWILLLLVVFAQFLFVLNVVVGLLYGTSSR